MNCGTVRLTDRLSGVALTLAILVTPGVRSFAEAAAAGAHLQSRIDAAEAGATITLDAGIHDEPIVIGKSITLRGESADRTMVRMLHDGPAIRIGGAEDVRLENLSVHWGLKSTDAIPEESAAIYVRDSTVVLEGVHLEPYDRPESTPSGMIAVGRSDVTFRNGTAKGFAFTLLYTNGANGRVESSVLTDAGNSVVTLHEFSNVAIRGNVLGFCGYHAVRNTGGTMDMRDNLVANNVRAGAYLGNKSAHGTIANNVFTGSKGEIWGYSGSDVAIANNLFLGSGNAAVGMQDSCNLDIRGNSFVDNPTAVTVYPKGGSGAPTLAGNHYWGNETLFAGIGVDANAIEGNPEFTDPDAFDFTVGESSALRTAGGSVGLTDPAAIRSLLPLWKKTGRDPLRLTIPN